VRRNQPDDFWDFYRSVSASLAARCIQQSENSSILLVMSLYLALTSFGVGK
jgi:hypothetical protein